MLGIEGEASQEPINQLVRQSIGVCLAGITPSRQAGKQRREIRRPEREAHSRETASLAHPGYGIKPRPAEQLNTSLRTS